MKHLIVRRHFSAIKAGALPLPIVMWRGAESSAKTWETTDGRASAALTQALAATTGR